MYYLMTLNYTIAISYNIIMYYPYGIKLYYSNFIQYNHVLSYDIKLYYSNSIQYNHVLSYDIKLYYSNSIQYNHVLSISYNTVSE